MNEQLKAKPRVVFPFVEAGLGHIMPMKSIADEFERLYGDKVEVVRSEFYSESGNKKLIAYEGRLTKTVRDYNKHPRLGSFATANMSFWGVKIVAWSSCVYLAKGAAKDAIAHMTELKPDMVVSTHYSTNYYAMNMKERPLTALYCPDARVSTIFRYPCDLTFVSMPSGYKRAINLHYKRFNESNMKCVPFLIRKEAFEITSNKYELRQKLGLDPDKFTVILAEGGYGIGKLRVMCEDLLKRDLPINLLVVAGKNDELEKHLKSLKSKGNTVYRPFGLVDNMLELIASADISCGKSGASLMAEPCFFGVPQLITHYACSVEKLIGKYYLETVGSAIKEFNAKKACDLIERFVAYPALLQPYRDAALSQKHNYGAETCARHLFDLLCTRFPELKDN